MLHIPTTDGIDLAVHEMAGDPSLPPLLISHATGFHARCYAPVADALADRFHVFGIDHRGHGDSTVASEWKVDWSRFGDDTRLTAEAIAPDDGLVGVGHSMGGAALLMAAHARPGLFDHLVIFEPIATPPVGSDISDVDMRQLPIVQGALRRRRRFPSRQAARDNYAAKPPLSLLVPEALDNYVEHGFRDTVDEHGNPAVELCCTPELEAAIFMGGRDNGVWELLGEIDTPCTVIGGEVLERQPSSNTEAVADRLPNGRYVLEATQTHFGPLTHPNELAAMI